MPFIYQSFAWANTVALGGDLTAAHKPMQSKTDATTDAQDTTDLDQDTIHELLSSGRRRNILKLLDQNGEMDKSDLAEHVASREYDKEIEDLGSQERKRVYIAVTQQHCPALADSRVIESNGTIQLTERADELLWHLEGKPQTCKDKIRAKIANIF